jgi:UTP--glucose-1-phosphate uridylyltransferase
MLGDNMIDARDDRGDYLRAVVRLACERPDIGREFHAWLEEFVAGRG